MTPPLLLHTPGQIAAFARSGAARGRRCIVIDQLRATSTIVTALAHGARRVLAVASLEEARQIKASLPDALLAGERGGLPPEGFDLGNSPRAFTVERVTGRDILLTTTNGTLALLACRGAAAIHPLSLLNLAAVADQIAGHPELPLALLCAGTGEGYALEDGLVAAALLALLSLDPAFESHPAAAPFRAWGVSAALLRRTANGRNLVRIGLEEDIAFTARRDHFPIVPEGRIGEVGTGDGTVTAVEITPPS
ncbi:2-phosphosulfolactate phosphatase [Verrucomicrobium sp. GAS474]|uniref:2-phosphosulfolactate phosphatase n=1 Tax=Verrucomicrobium sp. GAS474 TaxID=1882831 RepID=UPI00087D1E5B|nr:2-phosphosulfolactate phosphatase [Verrucomicrobium sp. GAS474]SDT96854.1 2-phosphosulfolactate phosphatase [Verrucomicrobium sp. GAS474]